MDEKKIQYPEVDLERERENFSIDHEDALKARKEYEEAAKKEK